MKRSSASQRENTGYIEEEVKSTGGGWRTLVVMVTKTGTLTELERSVSAGLCG